MAKMIFEELGGTYIRQGDYFLPCLSLPAEKETKPIGVWGQRHLRYLLYLGRGGMEAEGGRKPFRREPSGAMQTGNPGHMGKA